MRMLRRAASMELWEWWAHRTTRIISRGGAWHQCGMIGRTCRVAGHRHCAMIGRLALFVRIDSHKLQIMLLDIYLLPSIVLQSHRVSLVARVKAGGVAECAIQVGPLDEACDSHKTRWVQFCGARVSDVGVHPWPREVGDTTRQQLDAFGKWACRH